MPQDTNKKTSLKKGRIKTQMMKKNYFELQI